MKLVAKILKVIRAHESKKTAREKAKAVAEELRAIKMKEAAKKIEDGIEKTPAYCDFPSGHWTHICTNNAIERLDWEIRRCIRGCFPDGNPALMLVCARLRHVGGTEVHEYEVLRGEAGRHFYCRPTSFIQSLQSNLHMTLDGTRICSLFIISIVTQSISNFNY